MGIFDNVERSGKELILGKICRLLEKNPEKNVAKLFSTVKLLLKDEDSKKTLENIESYYNNNCAIKHEIEGILKNTNSNYLQKFFKNFLANAIWSGGSKRKKYLEKEDVKVPFTILISPSMRCNLHCAGCYGADYLKGEGLTFEEVDKIIKEARELGIHYFVVLGGEPFFVDYMFDIYKKYNDILFTPFTNGTLFTEEIADKLLKLGNVIPMLSLDGFEKETDARRGKGVFDKVMKGMDLLKQRGIPFGVSSVVYTHNMDIVLSDEFIDMLKNKGSIMSWYYIYMPVGDKANVKDMIKPEQRIELGRKIRDIRKNKPYFAIDFFNDASYVEGCIAEKFYCHINSKGDVEPCIFNHISVDNAKNRKLIDIFRGQLFKELRHRQPCNENMLIPCMMIDKPNVAKKVNDSFSKG